MASSYLINGGDPNHLLTGMILQVGPCLPRTKKICYATNLLGNNISHSEAHKRHFLKIRFSSSSWLDLFVPFTLST